MKIQILFIIFFILGCSSPPKKENPDSVPDFTPLKDDFFATSYLPKLMKNKEFGDPEAILYRLSLNRDGNKYITYHFVWEKEENTTSGFLPFLSRNIYTGGLSLQKSMFGKKDIELVSLIINPEGEIIQIEYETAENYDPKSFGVKHKHITIETRTREIPAFKVISWNHLFDKIDTATEGEYISLNANYFTKALWEEYTMTKESPGFFSRNRAQKPYELEYAE
jgi:hypothetical protein